MSNPWGKGRNKMQCQAPLPSPKRGQKRGARLQGALWPWTTRTGQIQGAHTHRHRKIKLVCSVFNEASLKGAFPAPPVKPCPKALPGQQGNLDICGGVPMAEVFTGRVDVALGDVG